MKRVLTEPKGYEYLTYYIYDTGYGFQVYKNGSLATSTLFETSADAEDFIRTVCCE